MTDGRTAAESPRLILILSSERSGSTLLRFLLGAHSQITAPSELFLMRYPDYRTWRVEKPVAIESLVEYFDLLGTRKTATEIDAHCARMTTVDVYRWMLSALQPNHFVVDKTPAYANSPESLNRSRVLRPFYVWLIRHPLGVIDSHMQIKRRVHRGQGIAGWYRRFGHFLASHSASRGATSALARFREFKWLLQQTNIRTFLSSVADTDQHLIRFEDLVTDPLATLQPLAGALGITIDAGVLSVTARRQKMNPALGDPNFHTHDRVEGMKATAWQARLSERNLSFETLDFLRSLFHSSASTDSAA
ncbi:MAG TPA: sulfotransferase [Candidatus Binatia bacterium]|nr:sulfotransferase [Candidatus Binatia bacterium]